MDKHERHHFSDRSLPILFHLDTLRRGEAFPMHWHENIELLYCIRGEGQVSLDSQTVPLRPGALTVISSGKMHYITSLTGEVTYYCLIIESALPEQFGLFVEEKAFVDYLESTEILGHFEQLIAELTEKKPYYEAVVKGEIIALTAQLVRSFSSDVKESKQKEMVKRGVSYLREHFTEDPDLATVAEAIGFSRYYFCREFKKMTGNTVSGYLRYLRCCKAEQLLTETDCTVAEVAYRCGFEDASYFTKVFKKQTGKLPSEYKHLSSDS